MSLRLKISIRGAVQGVGFRPFVFRLASDLGLTGWVNNSPQGVVLEVEGPRPDLEKFLLRLEPEKPPLSFIHSLETSWLDAAGYTGFEIRRSETGGTATTLMLPDIATCPECLREIFDPNNRRFLYPFTNCTHCGPRFSIIEALPYDRANTSMKLFTMCSACQAEYDDPRDRRFHAQPNACSRCGPHLELWDKQGKLLESSSPPALAAAAEAIRAGNILAVKGLGGFHLMVAAHNNDAVRRLRELKHREEKPFALMFPSTETVKRACELSPIEERLLRSPESPIVLLRRLHEPPITPHALPLASCLAPNNPNLGAMLPYTPLHHLLLSSLRFPIVATSGNLSDEPICTDERDALDRLGNLADLFLVHNRPIVRHVDDSIVCLMAGRELVLRRARGYAPLPITIPVENKPDEPSVTPELKEPPRAAASPSILAVGAHLKNAIALSVGPHVFISQHIGDLETDRAYDAFCRVIHDFENAYQSIPTIVVADAHPDYLSTKFARQLADQTSSSTSSPRPQLITIQHHLAHVLSCMAENEVQPPVLGISWDGTGYGLDGTVWGGEFFKVTAASWERVAHFRQFRLPGADKAVKEPRRTALGLLYEMFGDAAFAMHHLAPVRSFSPADRASLKTMLARPINSPLTSSAGRLFDAAAALIGLRQQVRFEAQAAMELEFLIEQAQTEGAYPFSLVDQSQPGGDRQSATIGRQPPISTVQFPPSTFHLDWFPAIRALLADLEQGVSKPDISARFHNGLVEAIVAVARRIGLPRVVLSGGCFQNHYLTERAIHRLSQEGFRPCWHQRVPPNDGGIALGQIMAALRP